MNPLFQEYHKGMEQLGELSASIRLLEEEVAALKDSPSRRGLPPHLSDTVNKAKSLGHILCSSNSQHNSEDKLFLAKYHGTLKRLSESLENLEKASPTINEHISYINMAWLWYYKSSLNGAINSQNKFMEGFHEGRLNSIQDELYTMLATDDELSLGNLISKLDCIDNTFTKAALDISPKSEVLRLTSILYSLKSHLSTEPEQGKIEAICKRLPDYAKNYLKILSNNELKETKLIAIKAMPEDERWIALANFVNVEQVPIQTLLANGLFSKDDLLQASPYLRYLDFKNNEHDVSFENRLIEACPHINYLIVQNATELPTKLHDCVVLICKNSNLTHLSSLPNCKVLDCSFSSNLFDLQERLRLKTDFPNLYHVTELRCSHCPALNSLPRSLPNCKKFDCSHCDHLEDLPTNMPKCMELNCSHNEQLDFFDNLEIIDSLRNGGAQVIADERFLRPTSSRSEHSRSTLIVDLDVLAKDPKQILFELWEIFKITDFKIPNIKYLGGEGIDVGGVTRDFVTRLFRGLFKRAEDGSTPIPTVIDKNTGVWLTLPHDNDREPNAKLDQCLWTIGILFAICCREQSEINIGEIFDPPFFALLKVPDIDKLSEAASISALLVCQSYPSSILDLTSEQTPKLDQFDQATLLKASFILNPERDFNAPPIDFLDAANRRALKEKLLAEAKQDNRIYAASSIVSNMINVRPFLQSHSPEEIQKKIQGYITAKALVASLRWEDNGHNISNTKKYLEHWINARKDDKVQLSKFVEAVTGCSTLGLRDLQIEVYQRGKDFIPTAHTCFFTLDVSDEYTDQATFDRQMNLLLSEGLSAENPFQNA